MSTNNICIKVTITWQWPSHQLQKVILEVDVVIITTPLWSTKMPPFLTLLQFLLLHYLRKHVNCIVIILATEVTHYRCTKWKKIYPVYQHVRSALELKISQQVFKMYFLIHTGLKFLIPLINSTVHNACNSHQSRTDLPLSVTLQINI